MTTNTNKTNDNIKETTAPFWTKKEDKDKVLFHSTRTRTFLELYGWGYYQSSNDRIVKQELFQNDNGVLRIHNQDTARKWVLDFLESVDEEVFISGLFQTPQNIEQVEVTDAWINMSGDQFKKILHSLKIFSEEEYRGTNPINLFRDTKDSCHIRFKNGVVKVTKDDIKLIDTNALKDKGAIWETEILPRSIEISSDNSVGLFDSTDCFPN